MSIPIWVSGRKKGAREARKLARKKARAKFIVEYDLAYDGGSCQWSDYYRTFWGARLDALWHVHFASWGGSAELHPYPKPTLLEEKSKDRKKGIFRGRK